MTIRILGSVAALSILASCGCAYAQSDQGHRNQDKSALSGSNTSDKSDSNMSDKSGSKMTDKNEHKSKSADERTNPQAGHEAKGDQTDRHENHARSDQGSKDQPDSAKRADDRDPSMRGHDSSRADRDQGSHDRNHQAAGSDRDRSGHDQDRDASRADKGSHDRDQRADRDRPDVKVSIDSTKRARISETIRNEHVENIRNVDFDVRVGGVIPSRYHFNPLPSEIATIVPQYRGYDYLVANNEIVIVEPTSHKIVYTMQEGRSSAMDHRSTDCR